MHSSTITFVFGGLFLYCNTSEVIGRIALCMGACGLHERALNMISVLHEALMILSIFSVCMTFI